MSYHRFVDQVDGTEYGSFEVFQGFERDGLEPGYYWWTCLPGCMPDSDPFGPFATYEEAVEDARVRR